MRSVWDELSREERCALLGAGESAMLLDVLAMWRPGLDYEHTSPANDVPRLLEAVRSLLRKSLVEVAVDLTIQPLEMALAAVGDERNWWTDDGPANSVELVATAAGLQVLASASEPRFITVGAPLLRTALDFSMRRLLYRLARAEKSSRRSGVAIRLAETPRRCTWRVW